MQLAYKFSKKCFESIFKICFERNNKKENIDYFLLLLLSLEPDYGKQQHLLVSFSLFKMLTLKSWGPSILRIHCGPSQWESWPEAGISKDPKLLQDTASHYVERFPLGKRLPSDISGPPCYSSHSHIFSPRDWWNLAWFLLPNVIKPYWEVWWRIWCLFILTILITPHHEGTSPE